VQLKQALDIHRSFKGGRAGILGDGFLMKSNPVYRAIMNHAEKIGCKFVEAYPRYLLMPFHELGEIVKTKKIPYVPSADLLERIENERPYTFLASDLNIPESYHLHEAAHVIAEHAFEDVELKTEHERILKAIVCESFANTVDALACTPYPDETHHFFLAHNCYMRPQRRSSQAIERLTAAFGKSFVFLITLHTYVRANFLLGPLPKRALAQLQEKCAPGVKLTAKNLKDCDAVAEMCERLDPQFRIQTTGNYLKLQGFEGDVEDILDFDFMSVFRNNKGFARVVDSLSAIIYKDKNHD
jgi:hypothetical protein